MLCEQRVSSGGCSPQKVVSVYLAYVRWWNLLCKDKHMWNYWSGRANSSFCPLPPIEHVDYIKNVKLFHMVSPYFACKCRSYKQCAKSARTWRCISFCSASLCEEIQTPNTHKCHSVPIKSDWEDSLTLAIKLFPILDKLTLHISDDTRHVGIYWASLGEGIHLSAIWLAVWIYNVNL